MTGKHPARLHMTIGYEAAVKPPPGRRLVPPPVIGNLPHEEATLAELLQAHGYLAALGKWHLGDAACYPETQGFDINIGGHVPGCPRHVLLALSRQWRLQKVPLCSAPRMGR
ncbi:MAG: sulfatase-like hydrolase/transferase [Thermoguttaceae bacterium]|nr:sulfatase-like hydrolase/transferase [Thermoguttaceae bacterium]